MLKICLVFWKSEPQYACKRYVYDKNMYSKCYLCINDDLYHSISSEINLNTINTNVSNISKQETAYYLFPIEMK